MGDEFESGRKAYDEFVSAGGIMAWPALTFDELDTNSKQAWQAVGEKFKPEVFVSPRELTAIHHAVHYSEHYPEAGAPGHNQYLLIATLAKAVMVVKVK